MRILTKRAVATAVSTMGMVAVSRKADDSGSGTKNSSLRGSQRRRRVSLIHPAMRRRVTSAGEVPGTARAPLPGRSTARSIWGNRKGSRENSAKISCEQSVSSFLIKDE